MSIFNIALTTIMLGLIVYAFTDIYRDFIKDSARKSTKK